MIAPLILKQEILDRTIVIFVLHTKVKTMAFEGRDQKVTNTRTNEEKQSEEILRAMIKASLILTMGPEGGYPENMRKKLFHIEKIEK